MAIAGRVAIVPKGDWSADATYKRLDAVTYNNALFIAKKEVSVGILPTNIEYWMKSIDGSQTIPNATKTQDGLMSKEDKTKIDDFKQYKPDGKTITADEDGTLHGVAKVTVDDALSPTSTNPVQNKVVKGAVDELKQGLGIGSARIDELNQNLGVERARIDSLTKLPEGSTTGDAELQDIRVKADGTTATSAGNAVREQVGELKEDLVKYDEVFKLNILPLQGLGDGTYEGITFTKSNGSVHAEGLASKNFGYQWKNMILNAGTYTIKIYSNATKVMPIAVLVGTSGWNSTDLLDDSTVYGGNAEFHFIVPANNTMVYFTQFFFIAYNYNCTFSMQLEKGEKIHGKLAYDEVYNTIPVIDSIENEIVEIKDKYETKFLKIGNGTEWTDFSIAFDYAIKNDLGVIITPGVYDFSIYHKAQGYQGLYTPKHIIGYGAKIISNLSDSDIDWDYSPLYTNRNMPLVIIEGLEIECTNCRYCIHDEMWDTDLYYTHIYKNLILTHHSEDSEILIAPQCIGGGLSNNKSGKIYIENCVFDSKHENDVNYHGSTTGQTGNHTIFCTNSVFTNTIKCGRVRDFDYLNTMYVSNCLCGVLPTAGLDGNAKTIAWNNVLLN